MTFQTSMIMFHVNLQGCTVQGTYPTSGKGHIIFEYTLGGDMLVTLEGNCPM